MVDGNMNKRVFLMQEYKWRYPLVAFLFALIVILSANILVRIFARRLDLNIDWATLGLGVLLAYVIRDMLVFYSDEKDNTRMIFTNYRDTVVIVFGLLVASSVSYILRVTLPKNLLITLAVYLFAILLALTIFFLGGSHELKKNTLPTTFQKNINKV